MTTLYTDTPTFEERVAASTLVILGRVEEVVDVATDYRQERLQVRTTFRVGIESVLKGRIEAGAIKMQVAGGKTDKAETPWSVHLKEGELALLMLVPNYANHTPEVFVPYFGSGYPVTPEGKVKLSEEVAKQLADQGIPVEHGTAKLAELRQLVEAVVQKHEKEDARVAEFEPSDLRKMPYGEVRERPHPELGGARSATPETTPEGGKKTN